MIKMYFSILAYLFRPMTVLFLAFVFTISSRVHAENHNWKITGMDYAPLLYSTESEHFVGTIASTVRALCVSAEITCSFRHMPLKRSMHMLATGELDATITIDTGKPKPCCSRSKWESPWAAGFFSTLRGAPVPETSGDLIGHSLITVLGMKSPYSFAPDLDGMHLRGEIELHKATSVPAAADMFLAGRAPLMWGSSDFTWHMRKLDPLQKPEFHARQVFPLTVWVRHDNPELLQALDRGYKALLDTNMLDSDGILLSLKPDH